MVLNPKDGTSKMNKNQFNVIEAVVTRLYNIRQDNVKMHLKNSLIIELVKQLQ